MLGQWIPKSSRIRSFPPFTKLWRIYLATEHPSDQIELAGGVEGTIERRPFQFTNGELVITLYVK
jgi:hypothetical protein